MNNNNQRTIWFFASAIVILIAGICFSAFKINNTADEIVKVKQDIRSVEEISEGHRERVAQLEEYQSKFDDINLRTVDEAEPREFSQFIQEIADDNNVIARTDLGSSDGSEDSAFFFKISADCSYEDCLSFLNKIENSKWLLKVYNVKIAKNGEGKVSMSFEIKAYTKSDES